jgi:hypothetical protein
MIPLFDDQGYLPPGIHQATLEEIETRFGRESEGHVGDHPMTLRNRRELENTRAKLRLLEDRYEASKSEHDGDEHVRELSRISIKRLINQLKEEIARFEAHAVPRQ